MCFVLCTLRLALGARFPKLCSSDIKRQSTKVQSTKHQVQSTKYKAQSTSNSTMLKHDRKRPTIGLALSGGAARGIAHVGVLLALGEHKIPIDYVAGTSA